MFEANPIDRLLDIGKIVDQHASPSTAKWFQRAVHQYLTGGNQQTLEKCLGLTSPGAGKPKLATSYRKRLRDEMLQQAFKQISQEHSVTVRCEQLAKDVKDFEARIWPLWRDLEAPPARCSELRRFLFLAAKTGEPLPTNWRTVYRVIKGY
jgi:hypothetical protein